MTPREGDGQLSRVYHLVWKTFIGIHNLEINPFFLAIFTPCLHLSSAHIIASWTTNLPWSKYQEELRSDENNGIYSLIMYVALCSSWLRLLHGNFVVQPAFICALHEWTDQGYQWKTVFLTKFTGIECWCWRMMNFEFYEASIHKKTI